MPVSSRVARAVISVAIIASLTLVAIYLWPGYLATGCGPSVSLNGREYCSEKVVLGLPDLSYSHNHNPCFNLSQYAWIQGPLTTAYLAGFTFGLTLQYFCGLGVVDLNVSVIAPDHSIQSGLVGPSVAPGGFGSTVNWTTSSYQAAVLWKTSTTEVTVLVGAKEA